jgi:hypothetical protein
MRIKNLRYSAKSQAFKASVDINRFGRTFRYPCEVYGPQTMAPATVVAMLQNRALQMSDTAY